MSARSALQVLRSAPWLRAPLLLARTFGVLVACACAMAVLAAAASSGVLFLASAGTASLHGTAAEECPEAAQAAITDDRGAANYASGTQDSSALGRADTTVRAALRTAGLPAPQRVTEATVPVSAAATDVVTLYSRPGATAHVTAVDSRPGPGVWLPQSFAQARHLSVGARMQLGTTRAVVAGVYRDLAPSAFVPLFQLPRSWCTWSNQIVPQPLGSRPPPFVLADPGTLAAAAPKLSATWFVPTDIGALTVPQAHAVLDRGRAAAAALDPRSTTYSLVTELPYLLSRADRERSGLHGAVLPIAAAGTLVAALLVASAGAFWAVRRRRELDLLHARGIGRAAIAVKATLESLPALLAGAVAGWALAIVLVRALGPSSLLEPGAPWRAAGVVALAALGGLAAFALLGAQPTRRERRRPWLRVVPWEVLLLAASVLTYLRVRLDGAVRIVGGTVQINALVLAFPLLALTGAVVLLARVGTAGLVRIGKRTGRLPAAAYLALRRVTGTPAVAVGTVIGVAIPVGVLIYAAALSGSTRDDVSRKYQTNVGAGYAFGTLARRGSNPDLAGAGTVVSMFTSGVELDGGTTARMMGVDPARFARFAYRGEEFAGAVRALPSPHRTVNAILVNAPAGLRVTHVHLLAGNATASIPITVVSSAHDFPGERDAYLPLLVVDRSALPARLPPLVDRIEEVWTDHGSVHHVLAALRRDGIESNYEVTPASFLDSSGLRPVTWIFGYLRALAYLTGLVAVTGLAFAFTARTRRRALSYYVAHRMGLSRSAHRRSIAIELGGLVVASWAAGAGLAAGAVGLVYELADVYPAFPPPPVYPLPAVTILATGCAVLALAGVATWALQRMLDVTEPAGLLRA